MGKIAQFFGLEQRKAMPTYGGIQETSYVLSQANSFFSALLNNTGQTVNSDTAEKVAAFYACVRNISEDIAKVGFYVVQYDSKGNKTITRHRSTSLLNKMPSSLSTPFTFRQTLIKNALIFGNGYAYIERSKDATPTNLYILDSRYVTVQVVDQRLYYIVNDVKAGIIGTFTENDIFHVRGMGDGYVGKSIITYGAESIGAALAVQTYAGSFFGSGATLGGYIEVPGVITDENVGKKIGESFTKSYKTPNGANNGIGVLHSGAKFQKFTAQPNESQMVETREFTRSEIASWFRMPLSKIQTGPTGSSNLEQLNIEYVTDCLMPWFVKLEQEIERKLFRFDEMDLMDAKFDVSQLMRGDMESTSNYLKTLFYAGMINRNDARRFIDLNTISEDYGNTYYSPVNMIPANDEKTFWASKDNSQASQKNAGQGGEQ
jgi:HK97 family phage portal protein